MERSGVGSVNVIHYIVEIPHQEDRHDGASTTTSRHNSNIRTNSWSRPDRRRMNSVHYALWISVDFILLVIQIVASIIVLSLSRHEHPRTPLFQWIVGYAIGCAANLPVLHWRFYQHNCIWEEDSFQSHQTSPRINESGTNQHDHAAIVSSTTNQASPFTNTRVKFLKTRFPMIIERVEVVFGKLIWRMNTLLLYFKISLDGFFAIWVIVGTTWIFGKHSSAYDAPNLYRLCIVFLVFSCIGYAMLYNPCSTICCCLPCIISVLGVREDLTQNRGATSESINALPTFKFKIKKNKRSGESHCAAAEGGVVATGTEKEREITEEDAVCCICLAKYENNDELRELPCSHFFHKECVDKWLNIKALCPLCKSEVRENFTRPNSGENATQLRFEVRVENGVSNTAV